MADNINMCDDDKVCVPLAIDEHRLKEMKAMEEAEQRLIEDLFATRVNTIPVSNQTKKSKISKKPK